MDKEIEKAATKFSNNMNASVLLIELEFYKRQIEITEQYLTIIKARNRRMRGLFIILISIVIAAIIALAIIAIN